MKDLDYLKANNLALGASLDNAIGVDDTGVVNEKVYVSLMSSLDIKF